MGWYIAASGEAYTGDQGIRADGTLDPQIADRPDSAYTWNGSTWTPGSDPQYIGLYNELLSPDGLSVFLFVRSLSDQNLPIANAYGDFVSALTTPSPSLPALQSCINNLFASLQGFGQSFSQSQIATMRSLLDRNGFQVIAFPISG